MASQVGMRHIRWLLLFVSMFAFRTALCQPSLIMEHNLTGERKKSVTIPCTYTPLTEYEEIEIEWLFENDQRIIHRIESHDDIPLQKYRNRVEISTFPPGDVSLTVRNLDVEHQGHFKCKVTWRDSSGQQKSKEDVTMLKVVRKIKDISDSTDEEPAPTGEPELRTKMPVTPRPVSTTEKPKATTIPFTQQPVITTEKPKTTSNSHQDSSVQTDKESSTTKQFSTTGLDHDIPELAASRGSGHFLYIIIIVLACAVCILIFTVVLIARRKKNKEMNYSLTMAQLALESEGGSNNGGGCPSSANPASGGNNVYELCIPVSEYHHLPASSNDYEQLLIQKPEEKNGCDC